MTKKSSLIEVAEVFRDLTTKQEEVVKWSVESRFSRQESQLELALRLNVSPKTIYNWQHKEWFIRAKTALAMHFLSSSISEVMAALIREAEKGNIEAIRLVLELLGFLDKGHVGANTTTIIINEATNYLNPSITPQDAGANGSRIIALQRG
jgi:hypothetical protein